MPSYTYYVKADFWGKNCRGNLIRITVSNRDGNIVVVAPSCDPKYSGEVKIIYRSFVGTEMRLELLNKEGCYIITDERHDPQDSITEMYKKLVGDHVRV